MLLHGDGTNGAQNNTFLDSSTNNFTITRSGTLTQGSFSPYGSNWSNFFDGASYFTTTSSQIVPAGSFTVECLVYVTSTASQAFVAQGTSGNAARFALAIDGGYYWAQIGSATINAGLAVADTWTYLAATFDGGTLTLYVNGTSVGSVSTTTSAQNTTLAIGNYGASWTTSYYARGYISNVRISNIVRTITTPTAPYTSDANTNALICQSNRIVDAGPNAYAITITEGIPSVQRFNPFGTATAYSTSVIGGSLYTDGSGALQLPTNEALAPRTSDFTFECWLYSRDAFTSSYGGIYVGDATFGIFIGQLASGLFGVRQRSNADILSRTSPPIRQWIHIAVSRSGTSLRMFYNGIQQGATVTDSTDFLSGSTSITDNNFAIYGYLSNLRFVKGTAVYTSNFTPPTAPVTAITNTQLLTNFTNGAIFDNAMINNLETAGNAQISTSVVKYGTGSLYFDGTGDYLVGLSRPSMSFGSGNFTVEAWVYRQVTSGTTQTIYQKGRVGDSNFELSFVIETTNQLLVYYSTDGTTATLVATTTALVPQNTWTHIAVTRSGSTWRVFIGGTLDVSATASVTLYTGAGGIGIAANIAGASLFTGYIDDLRITNGYARYTANFTPPTAAFPNTGPT
jgi:hypothetical protein